MSFPLAEYRNLVETVHRTMLDNADIADARLGPDRWTIKELVGHLIDSASNNHQRFIRLQQAEHLAFPAYDPDVWKAVSRVADLDYRFLVEFWNQYNLFLLYLIERLDPSTLQHVWTDKGKTLEFLVTDYFVHLSWHLDLFRERADEIRQSFADRT